MEKNYDIFFYGNSTPRRQALINQLLSKGLKVYHPLGPFDLKKAVEESCITLYIHPAENEYPIPYIGEILKHRGFLLAEKFLEHPQTEIKDGRDFVFGDLKDLLGLVDYFLAHPDEVRRISDSGYRNVLKGETPQISLESHVEAPSESLFLKNRNYFFIVGSQRSGTTLLELMLDSHPDIQVFGEPWVYDKINNKNAKPLNMTLGFKIPMWAHRWKYFEENFPSAKILFTYRSIRAIAASMVNLRDYDGTGWVQTEMPKEMDNVLPNISNPNISKVLAKHYEEWKKDKESIRGAALCAYAKQKLWDEYERSSLRCLKVSYEDLVMTSDETTRKICRFLGLRWDERILKHQEYHKGIYAGATRADRPIDINSLEKWKRVLSPEQSSYVDNYILQLDQEIS